MVYYSIATSDNFNLPLLYLFYVQNKILSRLLFLVFLVFQSCGYMVYCGSVNISRVTDLESNSFD